MTRAKRMKPEDKTELMELNEPEQKQPETSTAKIYLDAPWTHILGLTEQASRKVSTNPVQLIPMGRGRMVTYRCL